MRDRLSRFNRLCNLEDWRDPATIEQMRKVLPHFASVYPGYPIGYEHRKHWEYAHVVTSLERLGAVKPDAWALSVAGGHEEPAFYLSNFVRWMFLVDIYGVGGFSGGEAQQTVLTNPDAFALVPYNRRRLVVEYMNALDLRFEENTFDIVFCLSSIEHFAGFEGARCGLMEMCRVLKPGGVAAVTTECIVNGKPDLDVPSLFLFSPETIELLTVSVPGLALIEPIDFTVSKATIATQYNLQKAVEEAKRHETVYPHCVVQQEDRLFTSVALFFRKE